MLKPKLAGYFESYADYHRHPTNRLTHKVAIPLIVFHIIAMLDWVKFAPLGGGVSLSLAMPIYVGVVLWYLSLNVKLGAVMAVFYGICFPIGWQFDHLAHGRWMIVGIAVFAWLIQLAGHVVWEKRQPAFLTNLVQALIGPFFFAAVLTGEWPPRAVEAPAAKA